MGRGRAALARLHSMVRGAPLANGICDRRMHAAAASVPTDDTKLQLIFLQHGSIPKMGGGALAERAWDLASLRVLGARGALTTSVIVKKGKSNLGACATPPSR